MRPPGKEDFSYRGVEAPGNGKDSVDSLKNTEKSVIKKSKRRVLLHEKDKQ